MRTIRNLAWFLLAFGLTVWAGLASAQDLKPAERRVAYTGVDGVNRWYNTPMAYCLARKAKDNPTATGYCLANPSGPDINIQMPGTEVFTPPAAYRWWYGGCRNPVPAAGQCSTGNVTPVRYCANGETPLNGPVSGEKYCTFTAPPVECKQSDEVFTGTWKVGRGKGAVATHDLYFPHAGNPNDGSCIVKIQKVTRCFSRESNDPPWEDFYCTFEYVRTGGVSEGVSNEPPPVKPVPVEGPNDRKDVPASESPNGPCPQGTVNAGLSHSGVPMCMGSGTDPKNKPPAPPKVETEKTETADDGTKTTTKTETIKNSDGTETKTTTVTITKPDGTKTTNQDKTTTTKPDGSPGKDDSDKDDEKYDLCKQNPNLTICNNSTVSGKCAEVACTGDAIQCATLRAASAMQCQVEDSKKELVESSLYGLGKSILEGNDPQGDTLPNPADATKINIGEDLNSDGWIGARSGMKDLTFELEGNTITIPFADLFAKIEFLKYVIMFLASMRSVKILSTAVLGA